MKENMEYYEQACTQLTPKEKKNIKILLLKTPTPAKDTSWFSSHTYKKILMTNSILNNPSKSNNELKNEPKTAHFSIGFRARNIIYYVDPNNFDNTYFLSVLKRSETGKYPNFWEFPKGGFEYNIETLLIETAKRELIEEVYDDLTVFDGITLHHSDRYSPILQNPDILMIRSITEQVVHTHFDFITTYFTKANRKFNSETYWKRNLLDEPEHIQASWDTIRDLRKKFNGSAKKGFDRDYLYLKRILPNIPVNKLYFMNEKEKSNLSRSLDNIFIKKPVRDSKPMSKQTLIISI